eukprot:scaffold7222_cov535-Prasinococcus_capsulatus_cf.AAC.11
MTPSGRLMVTFPESLVGRLEPPRPRLYPSCLPRGGLRLLYPSLSREDHPLSRSPPYPPRLPPREVRESYDEVDPRLPPRP